VLVVHNRYRVRGGEERAVDLQLEAFARAGIAHGALVRDSRELPRARAARSMLRGGELDGELAAHARELGATVVHVHNMHPLFGARALAAARSEGARVVLHLHNFRLFCAIAVCFRDGESCFRCRGRMTLPGLALNCRGSLAESAVYAAALALHQPAVLEAVDVFVTPSRFAAGQLARLGLDPARIEVVANYLPQTAFAERSRAADGDYALALGRLADEKGFSTAIEAARGSGVPLKIAGDGPLEAELRAQAGGAPVELLGRVSEPEVARLLAGAAMAVVPSVGPDVMPFAALEAMAAGVPVVAARSGSLPELGGPERCVPRRDAPALARAMSALWADPGRRGSEGDALLARARERFAERRYLEELLAVYAGTHAHA
jgi:glycosyltransferase involved in cell wall biosynthesis